MQISGLYNQFLKEFREFTRSFFGRIFIFLSIAGSAILTSIYIGGIVQHSRLNPSEIIFDYWNNQLILVVLLFIYPSILISRDRESGFSNLIKGLKPSWSSVFVGKLLFLLSLVAIVSLIPLLMLLSCVVLNGFTNFGVAVSDLTPFLIFIPFLMFFTISLFGGVQAMFFSSLTIRKVESILISIFFYLFMIILQSNLYAYYSANLSTGGDSIMKGLPFYGFAFMSQSVNSISSYFLNFGQELVHKTISSNAPVTSSLYPLMSSFQTYLEFILIELLFLLISTYILIPRRD